MPDLLVNLYDLTNISQEEKLKNNGIVIKRALPPDKNRVLEFIRENFSDGWANECEYSLFNDPVSCYIAVREKKIVGFACYDATARDFFGPIGILETERSAGIGRELLFRCLMSMKEKGYAYAIIGWVGDALKFYQKTVNAKIIPDWTPDKSVYSNLISGI